MIITEKRLRQLVKEEYSSVICDRHAALLKEDSGPETLRQASTGVIKAINDENPALFWSSIANVLEGLVMSLDNAPTDQDTKNVAAQQAETFKQYAEKLHGAASRFAAGYKATAQKKAEQPARDAEKDKKVRKFPRGLPSGPNAAKHLEMMRND